MRPIVWGFILTIVGCFFWIVFSIFAAVEQFVDEPGGLTTLMYIFGALFFFSIPVAIVAEIVRWRRGKKKSQVPEMGS